MLVPRQPPGTGHTRGQQEALGGRWRLRPVRWIDGLVLPVGSCPQLAVGLDGLAELAVEVLTLDRLVDFDGMPVGLGPAAGWPDGATARFDLAG